MATGKTDDSMVIQLSLDTRDAQSQAQAVGTAAQKGADQAQSSMSSLAAQAAVATAALAGVAGAVMAVVAHLNDMHDRAQALGRVQLLGGSAADVARVEGALGGVISRMDALKQAADMRSLGFTDADIAKYLELQRVIMGVTGATAEQAAQMIQSGKLSEQALTAMGRSAQGLELSLLRVEKAQGDIPPTIAQTVRAMHSYLAVSDEMRKATTAVTEVAPWKQLTGAVSDFATTVADRAATAMTSFVDRYRRAWRNVLDETRMILGRAPMQVAAAQRRAEAAAQALTGINVAAVAAAQADAAAKAKATAETEKLTAAEKKRLDEAKKAAAEMKRLRGEGKEKEEKTGIDEFGRSALAASVAVFAAGGALVDAEDRAKSLASAMDAAAGRGQRLAHQQAVYVALAEKGAVAASSMARDEERRVARLRSALIVSDAERSNQAASLEIADLRTALAGRELATRRAVKALADSENDLAGELAKRANEALGLYRQRVAEQIKLVETARKIADFAAETQMLKEQSAARAEQARIEEQIRQTQAEIQRLRGREVQDRGEALLAQAQQLRHTIDQITNERSLAEARKLAATGDTADISARIAAMERMEDLLFRQVAALREQAMATATAADEQRNLASVMKRTAADMLAPTRVIADTARQIMTTATGAAQATISAVGGIITALVAEPENAVAAFGAALLGAAGDVALQMAAFYAALGVAEMATVVGIPKGIGLLAAAAGLAAVGGTLKGVGALVASPPPPRAATSGGGGARTSPEAGVPGQRMPRDERPVQIFMSVSEEPWNRRSDADRYRDMVRWVGRAARQTGVKI